MNLNLLNEVIAGAIGVLTSVLVPYLNRRFGMNIDSAKAASVASDIVDAAEKRYGPKPPTTTNETGAP